MCVIPAYGCKLSKKETIQILVEYAEGVVKGTIGGATTASAEPSAKAASK